VFEHFSEQARRVFVYAQEDARELGHDYIGTEHVLLGMLRQEGVARDALTSLGMSSDAVCEQVVQIVGRGPGMRSGQVPLTAHAKNVLERTRRAFRERQVGNIGTGTCSSQSLMRTKVRQWRR
jgi:ATP-dependent Clp protease ATP-binding subunit ClpC